MGYLWIGYLFMDPFKKHIENTCRNADYKLHTLRRIRKYSTVAKAKLLGNVFIYSQFSYPRLIRMSDDAL